MSADTSAQTRSAITPPLIAENVHAADQGARLSGDEWALHCIFHAGDEVPSLHVNAQTGLYHCKACGAHGDQIAFTAHVRHLTPLEAAAWIKDHGNGHSPAVQIPAKAKPPMKPATDTEVQELHDRLSREPGFHSLAPYRAADGKALFCIARHEPKKIRPWYLTIAGNWIQGQPLENGRPLLWLQKLLENPLAATLLVEGEKTAAAAREHLRAIGRDDVLATTWAGGANAWRKTDFSPLHGRTVYLFPDADKAGVDAMNEISRLLEGKAKMYAITPQKDAEEGEDCADIDTETFKTLLDAAVPWEAPRVVEMPTETLSRIETEKLLEKFSLSDLGNVERFMRSFKDEAVYVPEEGDFYQYDGQRWARDIQGKHVSELIDCTVRSIYGEARNCDSETTRKAVAHWALKSEHRQRRRAIFEDLKHRVVKPISEFDRDPWLFNVQNGTINLKTGELRPHDCNDFLMKISPVTFDTGAACPLWLKTLKLFFRDSKPVIDYVQKLFGYTMTGVKNERLVVFLYGRGRNGKTTITGTPLRIFGDYGASSDISTFIESKYGRAAGSASEDVARLLNKRYVRTTEIGAGDKLNEKLVKDVSGGDIVTARFLFSRSFDFQPCFTLWMFGNEKIKITGQDTGIKDRVKFIPLTFEIPKSQEDPTMRDRLFDEEASGILNWLIQGCLQWQKEGLGEPDEIKEATSGFFAEQDPVGLFIKDCCDCDEGHSIKYGSLYDAFMEYTDVKFSKYRFSKTLEEKGYEIIAAGANSRFVLGITLKGGLK